MTKNETQISGTPAEVLDWLADNAPYALLLEPREVYDVALVGATCDPIDHWPRNTDTWVGVYDEDQCVEDIKIMLDCDDEQAVEWFDFNTSGAWIGPGTPTFRSTCF